MRSLRPFIAIANNVLLVLCLLPATASAQSKLGLPSIADGFEKPVAMAFAPNSNEEFYVAEQAGLIHKVVHSTTTAKKKALDVASDELSSDTVTVLDMLAHPKLETNRQLIISYRLKYDSACFLVVSKFVIPENHENETEELQLFRERQPCGGDAPGGGMAFGEGGMLYIGVGVGRQAVGEGPAQNPSSTLGKILRVDIEADEPYAVPESNPFVASGGGEDEVFALGFQNPHRLAYDGVSKTVFTTDRGKGFFEEINIVRAGGNYGWGVFEGSECQLMRFECMGKRFRRPMFQYAFNTKRRIVGGMVYRGEAYPSLDGRYLFAEFPAGRLWAIALKDGKASGKPLRWGTKLQVSDIAADSSGQPYLLDYKGGQVLRVVLQ